MIAHAPLSIDITADGKVMIQSHAIDPGRLVDAVAEYMDNGPARGILIRADRESRTGLTVSVMSRLKNAGYYTVTLAVEEAP